MVAGKLTFSFIEGPLPNGGLFGKLFFFDTDGRPCVEKDCASVLYVEYGADGRAVFECKVPTPPCGGRGNADYM